MRRRRAALALLVGLACNAARAQQNAPVDSRRSGSLGGDHPDFPGQLKCRAGAPRWVEQKSGEVIYGLGADAFSLTDNGVPQKLHVDDDLDMTPVSLVVCLEKGPVERAGVREVRAARTLVKPFSRHR